MNYLLLPFALFFHHFLNAYTPVIIAITAAIVTTMPTMAPIVPKTIVSMLPVLSPPAGPVVPPVAAACTCVQNIRRGSLILEPFYLKTETKSLDMLPPVPPMGGGTEAVYHGPPV